MLRFSAHPRLRDVALDDSGVAIITVIGVVAVLTVVALAAYAASMQAITDVSRTTQTSQAFQAANAGIDSALSRMQTNGYVPNQYPLSGSTQSGSYTASITPAANSQYVCRSVGMDSQGSTETVMLNFFYLNLWNMNMANGSGGLSGGGLVGTTNEWGPFYIRGNVGISGNTAINYGPLFILGGDLTLQGNGKLGGSGGPIDLYCSGAYPAPGSKGMNVGSVSQSVPDIQLPTVDTAYLNDKYTLAKAESVDNIVGTNTGSNPQNLECMNGDPLTYTTMDPPNNGWTRAKAPGAASTYKVIGSDSTIGALGAGTHPLVIGGQSFGSGSGDGHYTLGTHDDFWYNDSTGILYVEGTVFVDGPLTINKDILYRGRGAIVCNGDITLNGHFKAADTVNNYMDADHVVGLVTPGSIHATSGGSNGRDPLDCSPDVCGAFFSSQQFESSTNVIIKGSIIAGGINLSHPNAHLVTEPDLPSYIPDAMPGVGTSYLVRGVWTRN